MTDALDPRRVALEYLDAVGRKDFSQAIRLIFQRESWPDVLAELGRRTTASAAPPTSRHA